VNYSIDIIFHQQYSVTAHEQYSYVNLRAPQFLQLLVIVTISTLYISQQKEVR